MLRMRGVAVSGCVFGMFQAMTHQNVAEVVMAGELYPLRGLKETREVAKSVGVSSMATPLKTANRNVHEEAGVCQ